VDSLRAQAEISLHPLLLGFNWGVKYPILSFLLLFVRSKCFVETTVSSQSHVGFAYFSEETSAYLNL